MPKLPVLSSALLALILSAAAGLAHAQNVDCRSCHAPGAAAADFSAIYGNIAAHHPVDISYPLASENFRLPDGQSAYVTFFDRNANGQPDSDEVQLFGAGGTATITCASCHKEHGTIPLPANAPADVYLRVTAVGSALCSICHNQ